MEAFDIRKPDCTSFAKKLANYLQKKFAHFFPLIMYQVIKNAAQICAYFKCYGQGFCKNV